jgi:uracil DNA glycosylase
MISRQEAFQIFLRKEMEEPYFKKIQETVRFYDTIDIVTPDYHNCLNCLNFNDIRAIKVIIIGYKPLRDYYAADYLAFSSYDYATYEMQRLYKKIYDDTGQIYNQNDNTKMRWFLQGILPINFELTSRAGDNSRDKLWYPFTKRIIKYLINDPQPRVFLFFDGVYTMQNYELEQLAREKKHLVYKEDVMSEFFTSKPIFNNVNNFVKRYYNYELDWT